jgi:hypothetical protein
MNLNESQLAEIQEMAGLFLEPDEIAVLLDIDIHYFITQIVRQKGPVYLAYFKGKTLSKKAIHENIIKMAKHGSPQAEEMAKQLMSKQQLAEKRVRK